MVMLRCFWHSVRNPNGERCTGTTRYLHVPIKSINFFKCFKSRDLVTREFFLNFEKVTLSQKILNCLIWREMLKKKF